MTKILVIEDEQNIRETLTDLLEAEKFEVFKAENGLIGLGMARKVKPDLVICDIMMPGLDGHGVLTELRQEAITASVPFIFLTARGEMEDLRQGMNRGADDYLIKPFTRKTLFQAVNARLTKQNKASSHFQQTLTTLSSNLANSLPLEFAGPLSVITASCDLLVSEYGLLSQNEVVNLSADLQNNLTRLQRTLRNFLLYAQLEVIATNQERIKELKSANSGATKTLFEALAYQKAQQYDRLADLEVGLEEASLAIKLEWLALIVEELVDNAFKHSKSDNPVRLVSFAKNGRYVLYVTDSGNGMSAEQIANFGVYVQFERRIYEQQGAGLGLTITKRLVELHDGTISIESMPGHKTILRVDLPLA